MSFLKEVAELVIWQFKSGHPYIALFAPEHLPLAERSFSTWDRANSVKINSISFKFGGP